MPKLVVIPFTGYYTSPIGTLVIQNTANAIQRIYFTDQTAAIKTSVNPLTLLAIQQLQSYFEGNLQNFDLPLQPEGTTFQQKVWSQLETIPFGTTTTYQHIATILGDSSLSRATGSAIGKNPLAIVAPCHRVLGTNGLLTGYAWGLQRKQWLLDFEAKQSGTYSKLF
ncbi:MAG: methylated-DNA--[protein]-cysteine S-methyltransferase [Bacteroidia bacterium]|jgi:methylated-DNA-[protein]-cysteine S-methyltransferase|nr:methylated-DNA--[protein]-cysteine S-methyltransferase [Bacteroidia bacterium]